MPEALVHALRLSSLLVVPLAMFACEGVVAPAEEFDPELAARLASSGESRAELVTGNTAMQRARMEGLAVTLPDGRVLVAGGRDSAGPVTQVEYFSPYRGLWTLGPTLPSTLSRFTRLALLPGGTVLVVDESVVTRINPVTNALVAVTAPPSPIRDATVVPLTNGDVLILGSGWPQPVAFRFRAGPVPVSGALPTDTWTAVAAPPLDGFGIGATQLRDGRVLAVSNGASALFSLSTGTWQTTTNAPFPRTRPEVVALADGRAAVVGGDCSLHQCDRTVELFTPPALQTGDAGVQVGDAGVTGDAGVPGAGVPPPTGSWATGLFEEGHLRGAGVTLSEDGNTLVVAGGVKWPVVNGAFTSQQVTSRVERLNLTTLQLVDPFAQERLTAPRAGLAFTRLADGRLFVAGGTDAPFSSVAFNTSDTVSTYEASFDTVRGAPTCLNPWPGCTSFPLNRTTRERNTPNALRAPGTGPGVPGVACVDGTAGTYLSDESIEAVRVYSLDGQPLTRGRQVRIVVDVWAWSGFTSDKLDLFVASDANAPTWQLVTTITPTRAGLNTLSATAMLPTGFSSAQAIRAQFRYGGSATPCVAGSFNDRDDLVFMPY